MNEWIRAARQYAGLTQTQLGERLGVTKGNVSAWERGHHEASLDQVTKIASATLYPEPLGIFTGGEKTPRDWVGWPFSKISQEKIKALTRDEVIAFEAVALVAASQLGLDIKN